MPVIRCKLADPNIAQNGIVAICRLYDIRNNSRMAKPNPKLVPKAEACHTDDGIMEEKYFAYCLKKIYFDNSSITAAPKRIENAGIFTSISIMRAKLAERAPNNKLVIRNINIIRHREEAESRRSDPESTGLPRPFWARND